MAFSDFLTPVLGPLLTSTGPFWTIVIVSLFISLLTTVVYKYTTNQPRLRKLKADLKRYQDKAKKLQKEDPKKAMKVQKDMMKINGEYMKHSFRSTLYTFLPVILFFGWLTAFLAFVPIVPGATFALTVTPAEGFSGPVSLTLPEQLSTDMNLTQISNGSAIIWLLQASEEGTHEISVLHEDSAESLSVSATVSTTQTKLDESIASGTAIDSVAITYEKLIIFEDIFFFKDIPWIKTWGWLGVYILFSLIFSTSLRKLMKVA